MKKLENSNDSSFDDLASFELSFDDITRKKLRAQLDLCPSAVPLDSEESELLMFLLYRGILY